MDSYEKYSMMIDGIISDVNAVVWGPVMLIALIFSGLFLLLRLKCLPWRNFFHAMKLLGHSVKGGEGDISSMKAFLISLGGIVGAGNIVGIAMALTLGGPGSLVWMVIFSLLAMPLRYAETVLAIKYREKNSDGEFVGGSMYVMKNGIENKYIGYTLALIFSIFTLGASLGAGCGSQISVISDMLFSNYSVPQYISGLFMAVSCIIVTRYGIQRMGDISYVVVLALFAFYVYTALYAVVFNYEGLWSGIAEIFRMAFALDAVTGGVGGSIVSSMFLAMQYGVAKGFFSNEAGTGSAAVIAASAKTTHPSYQGYVMMTAVFFDTIICLLTGLVIVSSGVLGTIDSATGDVVSGVPLVILAFSKTYGTSSNAIICVGLLLFCWTTVLVWEYVGEKVMEYLFNSYKIILCYRAIYIVFSFLAAIFSLDIVWQISEISNALMIIPNIICVLWLSNKIAKECFDYQNKYIDKKISW